MRKRDILTLATSLLRVVKSTGYIKPETWRLFKASLLFLPIVSTMFAVLEVGITTTAVCTNVLCEVLRTAYLTIFAPVHVIFLLIYSFITVPFILCEWFEQKNRGAIGLAIRVYLVLIGACWIFINVFIEDLMWHVLAWSLGILPVGTFHEFARQPFTSLPFPWWYPIAPLLTVCFVRAARHLRKMRDNYFRQRELLCSVIEDLDRQLFS